MGHHSDEVQRSRKKRRMPAEEGLWVFIFGDMMVFCLFFGVYLYYRGMDIETFSAAQISLNIHYGAVNTILLLTSSWFVAMALEAVRRSRADIARPLIASAFGCGLGFSLIKVIEYGEKAGQGYNVNSNDFFMFFFVLTGIHFLHLIVGMCVLTFLFLKTKRKSFSEGDIRTFEGGGSYWHMVDLLWIVLFPLLYLMN